MRYWVYINGQVLDRPFEKEELSSINGFTRETLICPEVVGAGQQQEWVAAHLVFEPEVEQSVYGQPIPQQQQQPLPSYYQYPQQQQQAQPYQTTRMPYVQQQPAYNPYQAAPVQTQYNQPVYQQQPEPAQYEPAAQTQNFDNQDMFETTQYDVQTQEALLEKIDLLTKEIQDVKQKLYALSDNLEYGGAPRAYSAEIAAPQTKHHTEKEKSSEGEKKEPQPKEEDDAAPRPVTIPPGYVDDIEQESKEDKNTLDDVPTVMEEPETEVLDNSSEIKDMDTLLAGAQAVSPSEDFLQDAINTTFSNKHKKETGQSSGEIVDLAKKENTENNSPEQIGTVVSDGNDFSEDDIPTVEEEFDSKLSFTQSNLEKGYPEEGSEEFYQEPAPAPEPVEEVPAVQEEAQQEEPVAEEQTEEPVAQEEQEPLLEDIPAEEPAQEEPVLEEASEQEPLQADVPQEEEPLAVDIPQEEPVQEEYQPAPVDQSEYDEPQEEPVDDEPKPFSIEPENDAQDNTETAPLEEVFEEHPSTEKFPEEDLPQEEQPVAEEAAASDIPAEQEEPVEPAVVATQDETPSLNPVEDDPMNIEESTQNSQESAVLEEFAADKKQFEENQKNMTSSAFDVIDNNASSSENGDKEKSALDELTGTGQPVMGQMPAEGEDQFLKTFTSSIEEVFLDQPTSIISDYVPPAQADDSMPQEDDLSYDPNAPQTAASLMDLKSAPQEDEQGLKKVRRIKPAAIKTVPMVAANGSDITTGEGQPNIEEAIAELGGNSVLEKTLKTFGTISGLLIVLLLFIALLAAMHIIPASWSPATILISKVFKKPAAEETASAVDASVEEALKEKEAKLAAAQEIIAKVKEYKLADGTTLNQKITALHPTVADKIEWTADQAVDPSYYSIAAKLPPNQEGYNLTYRFSYNTMDSSLVPTTSEANNIMQAAALPQAAPKQAAPTAAPRPQAPSGVRPAR